MKVAINRCYGGFSLSPTAIKELVDNHPNCTHIKKFTFAEYGGKPTDRPTHDYAYITDTHVYINEHRDKDRACPDMIEVIEKLGDAANGSYAKLRIVNIPDNINWEIDEYDGIEHVEEVHNSWY